MEFFIKRLIIISVLIAFNTQENYAQNQPNILWLLTDDQRYDTVNAFNRILHDREHSELGYTESPNVDKLANSGTTFINTYCQAAACAPSRTSMHLGRYPFRSGVYEFEYYNNKAPHFKATLPEQMQELGYQTVHIGKLGVRIRTLKNGEVKQHKIYQTEIDFHGLRKDNLTDWGKSWTTKIDGEKLPKTIKSLEFFVDQEGNRRYTSRALEEMRPEYAGSAAKVYKEFDLLRMYNEKKGPESPFNPLILAGESPQPAGKTRDGVYASILEEYLKNEDDTYTIGSRTFEGVDRNKPLFCHIGFDFPHTPVLPPKSYRDRFKKLKYKVPQFDEKELATMSEQEKKQVKMSYTNHFTDEQKQSMIQDYFAFSAYGDELIGQAVDAFIDYSEKNNQEWIIVYVCGDHGWKLNDHGAVSKFTSWDIDTHNPIIVVSSDKKQFPAGKVVKEFTEFVDIAPTILSAGGAKLDNEKYNYLDGFDLAKVTGGEVIFRDYVVGENHAVTGPRAFIRTKDYVFSIKTRPHKNRGKDLEWALTASYEALDPSLYHTSKDPKEKINLAFEKEYRSIAMLLKKKLIDVVLGDGRVEVNWGKKADGVEIFESNFAEGAHDYQLQIEQ